MVDGEPCVAGGRFDVLAAKPAGPEEGGKATCAGAFTGKLQEPDGVAMSAATGRVLVADSVKGAVYCYSAEGSSKES